MKLLALLIALALPATGWAAIGNDQVTDKQIFLAAGSSSSFSFAVAPTSGAFVACVAVGWGNADFDISSVTDNQTNTYGLVKSPAAAQQRAVIAYAHNVTSSGTFTVTLNYSSTDNFVFARCRSWTGLVTSAALDQSGTSAPTEGANPTVKTAGDTIQAAELVIAATAAAITGSISDPASGYTQLVENEDFAACCSGSVGYKVVAAIGAQSATWTIASSVHAEVIATFKEAGGAPPASTTGQSRRRVQ